jgi:hypothetical protein
MIAVIGEHLSRYRDLGKLEVRNRETAHGTGILRIPRPEILACW